VERVDQKKKWTANEDEPELQDILKLIAGKKHPDIKINYD
jgi:hypothetical protein